MHVWSKLQKAGWGQNGMRLGKIIEKKYKRLDEGQNEGMNEVRYMRLDQGENERMNEVRYIRLDQGKYKYE